MEDRLRRSSAHPDIEAQRDRVGYCNEYPRKKTLFHRLLFFLTILIGKRRVMNHSAICYTVMLI